MRKRVGAALVVFVCCLVLGPYHAQSGGLAVVHGRILDANGAPAVRIKVTIGTLWVYSDATGRYVLPRVPFGTYNVTLERDGRKIVKPRLSVRGPVTDVPDLRWP